MLDPATVTDELMECRYRYFTLPGAEEAFAKLVAEQPGDAKRAGCYSPARFEAAWSYLVRRS